MITTLISSFVTGGVVALITWFISLKTIEGSNKKTIGTAEERAKEIVENAQLKADTIYKEAEISAKESALQLKKDMENEVKEQRNEVQQYEKRVILEMAAALKKNDAEIADTWFRRLQKDYEEYKNDIEYQDNVTNSTVGEMGTMFESELPKLFVKNKRAVGEITRLIKEDANIKSQLQFFEAMKNYDGVADAKEYIKESVELASKNINLNTLKESNDKFAKLIIKYGVKGEDEINESKSAFFNAGTYLLTHKKKLNNLSQISANRNIVESYINDHKKTIQEDRINIKKLTEDFDKKMAMLNEDERALVNDIINSGSSVAEKRQIRFFNDLKEKCLDKINRMITESSDEDREGLESIKEEIASMQYCKETIIKDTAKLLEVGAVLSDNDNKKFF